MENQEQQLMQAQMHALHDREGAEPRCPILASLVCGSAADAGLSSGPFIVVLVGTPAAELRVAEVEASSDGSTPK